MYDRVQASYQAARCLCGQVILDKKCDERTLLGAVSWTSYSMASSSAIDSARALCAEVTRTRLRDFFSSEISVASSCWVLEQTSPLPNVLSPACCRKLRRFTVTSPLSLSSDSFAPKCHVAKSDTRLLARCHVFPCPASSSRRRSRAGGYRIQCRISSPSSSWISALI